MKFLTFLKKYRYEFFALLFLILGIAQLAYGSPGLALLNFGLVFVNLYVANRRNWNPPK